MQRQYPNKQNTRHWDTLYLEYPVKKFPTTATSSEAIARKWRMEPEVLKYQKLPIDEMKQYYQDYVVNKQLSSQSGTALEYGFKHPEKERHSKHTSCMENQYIYPTSRKLESRPPACGVHETTEMKTAYQTPVTYSRLATGKDQFKHKLSFNEPPLEPSWHDPVTPLDTTHEGFEKYLDPYLTTSRIHHRPFTADQLARPSASKDMVTYYTWSKEPWVRCQKPKAAEKPILISRPKSMYDREKFKQDSREIRTHNTLRWVPGSFRTEVRDNYNAKSQIDDYHEEVRRNFKRSIVKLPTNNVNEDFIIKNSYDTIYSHVTSGKPLCAIINQHFEKNKKLEIRDRVN